MKTGFTYVMSDIHGNAERFNSIINQIELKPEDSLYVLGDVIDRYPDGIRILRLLMSLPNVKLLLGNHEYMMLEALDYHADSPPDPWDPWGKSKYIRVWYANGGEVTHEYLKHLRKTVRAEIFEYLKSLPLNIEIEVGGIQWTWRCTCPPHPHAEARRGTERFRPAPRNPRLGGHGARIR